MCDFTLVQCNRCIYKITQFLVTLIPTQLKIIILAEEPGSWRCCRQVEDEPPLQEPSARRGREQQIQLHPRHLHSLQHHHGWTQVDTWMDKCLDRYRCQERWIEEQNEGQIDRIMDRLTEKWIYVQNNVQMDKNDAQIDRKMNRQPENFKQEDTYR